MPINPVIGRAAALAALAAIGAESRFVRSQVGTIALDVENVPVYGTFSNLRGRVRGAPPNQYGILAFVFVPDLGWWSKPGCGLPAELDTANTWEVDITTGSVDEQATRIAAFVVPATLNVCVQGLDEIPARVRQAAVAQAVIERPNPSPTRIRFSGQDWIVKSSPVPVGPGPNLFREFPNVFLDFEGRLHLRITRCGSTWCGAEVFSAVSTGYGNYRVRLASPVHDLDPNTVLGFFTWSEDAAQAHREIDIEFARWGRAGATSNAQFVVQPFDLPGRLFAFPVVRTQSSWHAMRWAQDRVDFESGSGELAAQRWTFTDSAGIPRPGGDTRVHLNFYLQGGLAPQSGQEAEAVIEGFQFVPLEPSVGFGTPTAGISGAGGETSLRVAAESRCSWRAATASPWIRFAAASGTGDGSVGFVTASNPGPSRQATIELRSENCDAHPVRRVVTLTQQAAPCRYTVAATPMHVPFGGGESTVEVAASMPDCPWSARPSVPWISIPNAVTQFGSGRVTLTIPENREREARVGSVDFGFAQAVVHQDGVGSSLGVFPNPLVSCDGSSLARAGLRWETVEAETQVTVETADGPTLGVLTTQRETETDRWVRDGMTFFLRASVEGKVGPVVASATARVVTGPCVAARAGARTGEGKNDFQRVFRSTRARPVD